MMDALQGFSALAARISCAGSLERASIHGRAFVSRVFLGSCASRSERVLMEPKAEVAVVFDLDGVLADTSSAHERAFSDVWRAAQVPDVPYVRIAGRPTAEVLEQVLVDFTDDERRELLALKRSRARLYLESTDLRMPGAEELVEALNGLGVPLGLVTGASRRSTSWLIERLGLAPYLSVVVTADDVPRGKPHPAGFRHAMRKLRVAPEHTLVVEDSRSGIAAAARAGAWVACVHSEQSSAYGRFCGSFATLRALEAWMFQEPELGRAVRGSWSARPFAPATAAERCERRIELKRGDGASRARASRRAT